MNKKIEKFFNNRWLELISRWILGFTLLYAAYYKIINPEYFAKIIYGYAIFPAFSINIIAIILPYMEFYLGLFLILGIYIRSASLLCNLMFFAFIVLIFTNIIRGHEFDCGCFGPNEKAYNYSESSLIIRDSIFLLIGFFILFFKKRRKWCIYQS